MRFGCPVSRSLDFATLKGLIISFTTRYIQPTLQHKREAVQSWRQSRKVWVALNRFADPLQTVCNYGPQLHDCIDD